MFFGQREFSFDSYRRDVIALVWLSCVFYQVLPVIAQGPQLSRSTLAETKSIAFVGVPLPVSRRGYVSIEWQAVRGAASYRLTSDDGHERYRGTLPKAFVSGLTDGQYEFSVEALDAQGQFIAASATPARVTVNHWPLPMAFALLTLGGCVVLSVFAVIIRGTWQAGSMDDESSQGSSELGGGRR